MIKIYNKLWIYEKRNKKIINEIKKLKLLSNYEKEVSQKFWTLLNNNQNDNEKNIHKNKSKSKKIKNLLHFMYLVWILILIVLSFIPIVDDLLDIATNLEWKKEEKKLKNKYVFYIWQTLLTDFVHKNKIDYNINLDRKIQFIKIQTCEKTEAKRMKYNFSYQYISNYSILDNEFYEFMDIINVKKDFLEVMKNFEKNNYDKLDYIKKEKFIFVVNNFLYEKKLPFKMQ